MRTSVNDRISELINGLGSNPNAFAEAIGVKATVIYNIIKGRRSKPSFEVLQKIFTTYQALNVYWLIKGEGEVWTEEHLTEEIVKEKRVRLDQQVVELLEKIKTEVTDDINYYELEEMITKLTDENHSQKKKIIELYEKQDQLLDIFRKRLNLDV